MRRSKTKQIHTRLRNADTDGSSLKRSTRQIQGFLQTIDGLELDVAKTLWALGHLVLHNTDICHIATGEKVGNITGGRVEGQVTDVCGKRRLGRKGKRLPCEKRTVFSIFL